MQAVERVTMLLIVALATGWVLYTSAPHGIGITPDSVHYLSAAQNLAKTGSLYTYTDKPLVSWATAVSTLYAVGYLVGIQGETAAVVVNVASFVFILLISGLWLSHFLKGVAFAVAMLAILLAKPVLFCALYAWSELPFVALTIIALYAVWRYVHSGKKSDWWVAAIVGARCPLMRYIGTSVTLCGTVFLLVYPYQTLRRRVFVAAGYLLATSLPLGLWLVRNKVVSGTLMGVREASDYVLWDILWDTLNTWHGWFVPVDFARSRTILVLLMLVACVGVSWLMSRSWRKAAQPNRAALSLLAMFVAIYSLQLVGSAATVRFYNLDTRFWMPAAVPVVLVGSVYMWCLRWIPSRTIWSAKFALVALFMGWLISGATFADETSMTVPATGIVGSIASPKWTLSPTISYLRETDLKGIIVTNAQPELFYLTGKVARWLPYEGALRISWEGSPSRIGEFMECLHENMAIGRSVYVVWFPSYHRAYLYSPGDLRSHLSFRLVHRFHDGEVLVVEQVKRGRGKPKPRTTERGFKGNRQALATTKR